mmetsp:Transcript_378/g.944  ORF Transcript_378/g.944 Transcript_378/m.944 type:complete len:227 (+) Transcript_378:428-1108(+)
MISSAECVAHSARLGRASSKSKERRQNSFSLISISLKRNLDCEQPKLYRGRLRTQVSADRIDDPRKQFNRKLARSPSVHRKRKRVVPGPVWFEQKPFGYVKVILRTERGNPASNHGPVHVQKYRHIRLARVQFDSVRHANTHASSVGLCAEPWRRELESHPLQTKRRIDHPCVCVAKRLGRRPLDVRYVFGNLCACVGARVSAVRKVAHPLAKELFPRNATDVERV